MGKVIVNKVKGMSWTAKISLVLVFTLAISAAFYVAYVHALNKVTNYAFPTDANGWTYVAGTFDFSTKAWDGADGNPSGSYKVVMPATKNINYSGYIYQTFTTPGTSGTVKAKGRLDRKSDNSNTTSYLKLTIYDNANTTLIGTLVSITGTSFSTTWTTTGWSTGGAELTLNANTTYKIRVEMQLRNTASASTYLSVDNIMVNFAPTGLSGSVVAGTTNASLTWTASTNGPSGPNLRGTNPYQVYRGGSPLAYSSTNSYTDSTAIGNTSYTYTVTDFDVGVNGTGGDADDNESPQSASVTVLTLPGAPGTPTFTGVTGTSITVNWTAPTGGAASYKVERAPDVSGSPGAWGQVAGGVTSPWTDNTVSCGTTYWYRVRGTNASGDGAYSGQASQTTSACVVVPTLTSPTATSITDTTATLGANITSDGGASITQYGTYWDTTPPPSANGSTKGAGGTGVFTDARTGLTAATKIYYRGYATNSAGTGYSPTGSFYTEPTTQASGVNFTSIGQTGMTVNWTRGNGSGVIVLMRQGSAVATDPSNGTYTTYTANSAFGSGTAIGAAYVIYKGTGTSVAVTGLTAGTTYYVAVYEFSGTVDTSGDNQGTNYKPSAATGSQATTAAGDQVNVTDGTDPANYTVYANDTNKVADGFTMATNANTAIVTAVNASLSNNANVSSIRLYRDAGTIGTYDSGVDTLLATVNSPGASVTFSSLSESLTTSVTNYLIVVDIAGSPTPGQAVIATVTGLTVTAPDTQGTITDSGTTLTIGTLTLTIADGGIRPAAATWCKNTSYVIDQFKLTASSGTITVSSIIIQGSDNVTGAVRNILSVELWKDTNNNGLKDDGSTQVGTTQNFPAAPAPPPPYLVTFSGLSETIDTTGTNYLVVYTVAASPTYGTGVTSLVNSVTASGPPNYNKTTTVSNSMTIKQYPSLITNFTAACAATSATLAWNNPPETNLGEVKVLRKTGGYPAGPTDGTATQVYQNLSPTQNGAVNVNDSPLTTGTTYYWAVYAKDNCGNWNTATTAGSNAASCMPAAADNLTVSNPAHPPAGNVAQASTNNVIDRLSFSANANDITITSVKIKLVDGAGTTPIQASDIASVHLYDDANKNGVLNTGETFLGSGVFSSVDNTCTISGLSFSITAPTTREMLIVFNIASAAVTGRKFKSQVDSGYITVASPDTVNAFTSIVSSTFTIIAGGGVSGSGFTVSILNPRDGGVVSGTFKVQVQVYWGANTLNAVMLSTDGGSSYPITLTPNANYSTGANSGIYETQINVPATLATGAYTLKAQAAQTAPALTATSRSIVVTVRSAGEGDGNLLARDNSSQLCIDCHALQTHSSQYSSTNYGFWAMNCRDCHTAHETRNIYLVREKIPTPADGLKDVTLYNLANLASAGGAGTGLCEVCHTQTSYYKAFGHSPGTGGHDTGDCSGCHGHNSGFKKPTCNSCHNAPPGNGKHALHYTGGVPTSYSNAANGSTAGAYNFPCIKCHNGSHNTDTHAGTLIDPKVVETKFDATVDPMNPTPPALYTPGAAQAPEQGPNSMYFAWSNGTCSGIYCHSNATPLTPGARGVPTAYTTPTWMGATTSPNCTVCHLGADTYTNMQYSTTTRALSDAHWNHVATDRYGTGDRIGCVKCHNATVSDNTTVSYKNKHVNGLKEVAFDTAGTWSSPNCSTNVYCHSDGQASPTYRTVAWNTAGPLACDACHYGNASNTNKMSSANHGAHIFNAGVLGTNYLCYQCHYNTTNTSADTISTTGYSTYHVNGTRDVAFNTALNPSGSWASPNCTSVYCHSTGQATPTYVNRAWGGAAIDCKGCHGTEAGGLYGEPRYANAGTNNNAANSHAKHVTSGNANCGKCHPATADNTGVMVASSTTHTDGTRQVSAGTGISFTYSNDINKTCTSTSCHGSANAQWGATLACNNCHNAPPSPGSPVDRHATHYNTATLPTSYSDVTASTSTTVYIYQCAKCHSGTHTNDTHAGTPADPKVVEVLFDTTVDPKNATSGTYTAGGTGYTDGGYKYTNGTCTNVYCHSNATPLKAASRPGYNTINYQTPGWTAGTTGSCTVCHLGADTYTQMQYSTTTRALSDAHWTHAATDRYNLGCKRCHNATVSANTTVSDKSKHANGVKEVAFDTGGTWVSPSCTTGVYCHSTGEASPTYKSVAWNTATLPLACDACHYGKASDTNPMATGKHSQHINQAGVLGTNYKCNQCHYNTTNSGADTIASYTYHVNGTRDVFFDTTGGKTNGTGPNWTAPATCTRVYCHSTGQSGLVDADYKTVPSWTVGGALDCKGCHGAEGGSLWGEPRYANGGPNLKNSNTHPKHVGPSASTGTANCGWCHPNTADNNGAMVASTTTHTDGSRQVAQGGVVTFTYAAGKTCNSISCHNGASSLVWGQIASLPTCLSCHGAAADSNDLGVTFWKNGTPSKINTNEWGYSGHGKTTGFYENTGSPSGTNPAANFSAATGDTDGSTRCYYCHDQNSSHYDDTNPFRLVNNNALGGGRNDTCLICHALSPSGYNPGLPGQVLKVATKTSTKVGTAHYGTKHQDDNTKGGRLCWDCHDPHGERNTTPSGNIAMIRNQVLRTSDGNYGYQGASGLLATVNLTSVTNTGQAVGNFTEATNPTRTGICQACHYPSEAQSTNMTKYWRYDGTDLGPVPSAHNAATLCTTCHKHTDNFKGAGDCTTCHASEITSSKWGGVTIRQIVGPRATPDYATFTTNKSGHLVNGNVATPYAGSTDPTTFAGSRGIEIATNWDCIVCHAEGDMSSTSGNIKTVTQHGTGGSGYVMLRNVDNPGAAPGPGTDGTNFWYVNNRNWNSFAGAGNTDYDRLDKFCLSCHDADGATGIAVNGTTGLYLPPTAPQALTPFNSNDNRRNAFDKFVRSRVTDVKTAMNRYNYSVHAMSVNSDPTTAAATTTITYYVNAISSQIVGANGSTNMTALANMTVTGGGSSNENRAFTDRTAPTGTATGYKVWEAGSATLTNQEFFRAYTRKYPMATTIAANATAYADFYMATIGAGTVTAIATLYEYNDTTGIVGAAKGTASYGGSAAVTTRQTMNNAINNPAFTVAAGNRLMVIFSFTTSVSCRPAYLWGQAASATPSGYQSFTVNETTNTTLGARYGSKDITWNGSSGIAWTNTTLKDGTNVRTAGETTTHHCSDCHLSTVNAHGARLSWYMLDNTGWGTTVTNPGPDIGPDWGGGTGANNAGNYVCFKCHSKDVYACADNAVSVIGHTTGSTEGNHFDEATNSVFGYVCMNCHGGGGTDPAVANGALGNIHGVNVSYKSPNDAAAQNSYRFFPGGWMMWSPYNNTWGQSGGSGTCYFQNSATWSGCSQHSGSSKTDTVTYGRPTNY